MKVGFYLNAWMGLGGPEIVMLGIVFLLMVGVPLGILALILLIRKRVSKSSLQTGLTAENQLAESELPAIKRPDQ